MNPWVTFAPAATRSCPSLPEGEFQMITTGELQMIDDRPNIDYVFAAR